MPVGTPDYQYGVANPQTLLAAVPIATTSKQVGVPPNVETLVVLLKSPTVTSGVTVQGVTTGVYYPGNKVAVNPAASGLDTWFFDVSNALDSQVLVTVDPAVVAAWWIYADTGTHVVVDVTKRVSGRGMQYVIPTLPSTAANDHPVDELQLTSPSLAATAVILAAPGAGRRYRVFSIQTGCPASGVRAVISDLGTGFALAWIAGIGVAVSTIPAQGYPLTNNAALQYTILSGVATVDISVYYTLETY